MFASRNIVSICARCQRSSCQSASSYLVLAWGRRASCLLLWDSVLVCPLPPFPTHKLLPDQHPTNLTLTGVFGLQIASTTLYAYVSDCYKPQTPESGVLFNLSRGLSFVVGYFAFPYAAKVGYFWAWFTFAAVLFSFFFPIAALMKWGEGWRAKLGPPTFHRYL